jgi:glycosyltransferase involved in cell wall biosynthesis
MVTTYNWEPALDRVLASVAAQHVLPDEVLVADDGSGPATQAVVERWAARLPVPVRHIWHDDLGFRLAAIRNRALAAARGEYVLMIDGDLVLHPEFVRSHADFARRSTYVQGSRVMVGEPTTRRMLAGEQVPLHFFARGIRNRFNAIHFPLLSRFHRGAQGPLQRTRGANLAYWLADARRVNGFNEDMEGWGREDSEFVARLQNAGVERRNFKFGGVTYHLHHKTRSQDAVGANHQIFERVVSERLTWCPNGMNKYVTPGARVVTPTRAG